MPKLVKLYITQVLIGFAIAAAFVGALLYFNVANLWHLVTHNEAGIIAVIVLWFANGIVFSGVQFAITIMRMAERENDGQGGKRDEIPLMAMEPIPVEAKRRH
ncbi:hypothetical protein [Celeribacter persicus]|uniref:Uncharacterized protein n=1 Tax=Celeribacter persicus TaxID=1651082 RepID=A0A2T5HIB2_9RHOB|nr:hypothetical protein [Celeribacter persicus]PTQ71304.1 hypothetical protein C8N42_10878 [Celeribacter persicus]